MKETMEPLYARSGDVYAWLDPQNGRIIGLGGKHIAYIAGDSVYNWAGRHIGWWHKDHMRDHEGKVVVFDRKARGLGPVLPGLGAMPPRPVISPVPAKPTRGTRPGPVPPSKSWTLNMPF